MKLLIEMNLSPRWVKTLADAGVEAEHWSSFGEATATDSAIMGFARAPSLLTIWISARFSPRSKAKSRVWFKFDQRT